MDALRKVGYVDDESTTFLDYEKRLKRKNIQLINAENVIFKEDFIDWITINQLKFIIVDFKLSNLFDFAGTDLVAYINSTLPDLPCMILTSYPQDSLKEMLVSKNIVRERSELEKTNIDLFVDVILEGITIFENRLKKHLIEFEDLHKRRADDLLTALEEERYFSLYNLLKVYGEVDDLPSSALERGFGAKMDSIINKLDEIINKPSL